MPTSCARPFLSYTEPTSTRRRPPLRTILNVDSTTLKEYALDPNGCWDVQARISDSNIERLVARRSFIGFAKKLCASPHGNHVLTRLIECSPPSDLVPIYEELIDHVRFICRHQYGSRVVERLIEHGNERVAGVFLDRIVRFAPELAIQRFGNYVVQCVLEHAPEQFRRRCTAMLLLHVDKLIATRRGVFVLRAAKDYCCDAKARATLEDVLDEDDVLFHHRT